jgi:hypothetical protein
MSKASGTRHGGDPSLAQHLRFRVPEHLPIRLTHLKPHHADNIAPG